MSTSSCDKCNGPSRLSIRVPSGWVSCLMHGVNVTELAAEEWNVELAGWEILENLEILETIPPVKRDPSCNDPFFRSRGRRA